MKLKVEINSREHFSVLGVTQKRLCVDSPWFQGDCEIPTYDLNELIATKLRALYQRKKGRDLFDIARAITRETIDPVRVLEVFSAYMAHDGQHVTRAQFEQNLNQKLSDPLFNADISPLLAFDASWRINDAAQTVAEALIKKLPGDPWRGGAAR